MFSIKTQPVCSVPVIWQGQRAQNGPITHSKRWLSSSSTPAPGPPLHQSSSVGSCTGCPEVPFPPQAPHRPPPRLLTTIHFQCIAPAPRGMLMSEIGHCNTNALPVCGCSCVVETSTYHALKWLEKTGAIERLAPQVQKARGLLCPQCTTACVPCEAITHV